MSDMLMNVIFSTMLTGLPSGGAPVQSSVTSFETYDELGCETTAKLLLGNQANINQGKWYVKSSYMTQTVICFPKASSEKPDVNRGNRE